MRALEGKTALVTGAAKRLGRATALVLAEHGANVVVHYNRSVEEADSTANGIREHGVLSWTLPADLGQPAEAARLMQRAAEETGGVDILINSASIFPADRLIDVSLESFEKNFRLNTFSPLEMCREFAKQGRGGAIVNFLDTRILDYDREHMSYHLSKRALFTLTRAMAQEFAPSIRVNAVAPGLVLPPAGKDQSYLDALAHTNPLQSHGSAEDVAAAVLFLVTNPFVTGQVIYVDGGRHMLGGVYH
ncbi:MAG: SDR family oxidoreductase [Candidatus Hydrogenedentota bacterium]